MISAKQGKSRTCNGSLGPGQVETEDEFPFPAPALPSPAFCVFSLSVAYLLTLPSTSPEDGKRNTADQVFTKEICRGTPV